MINIRKSQIIKSKKNGWIKLSSELDIDGKSFELYNETTEEWTKYLVQERADPFLVGVLFYAMRHNHDINCEMPVTSELLYNIETYLIPTLSKYDNNLHKIKIFGETEYEPIPNLGAVGTGLSTGVDCFNTIATQYNSKYKNLNLTHFLSFNDGAFGGYYQNTGWNYAARLLYERSETIAKELNLPLIQISTNVGSLIRMRSDLWSTYAAVSMVLSLGKLFKTYFYGSAGWDLSAFTVVPNSELFDRAHYDFFSLNCFSIQNGIRFYSEGAEKDRMEKIKSFADLPLAQKYLQSCLTQSFNCGVCSKCKRNLIMLDALGKLNNFKLVYDIDYYLEHRNEYLEWMCEQIVLNSDVAIFMIKQPYNILKSREPKLIESIENKLTLENLIAQKNELRESCNRWRIYAQAFRKISFNNKDSINKIKDFFVSHGYKKIIFYGNNEFTQYLCPLKDKIGINIDYIVEDTEKKHKIPRLPINTVNYPNIDAIIICSIINNPDLIKRKLQQRVSCPVHHVTEIFGLGKF